MSQLSDLKAFPQMISRQFTQFFTILCFLPHSSLGNGPQADPAAPSDTDFLLIIKNQACISMGESV